MIINQIKNMCNKYTIFTIFPIYKYILSYIEVDDLFYLIKSNIFDNLKLQTNYNKKYQEYVYEIVNKEINNYVIDIMKNDKIGYGVWKKTGIFPNRKPDQSVIDEILNNGMLIPHYFGFCKAVKWYHNNISNLPKWWQDWYIEKRKQDLRFKKWRSKMIDKLDAMDLQEFSHGSWAGPDYTSEFWTEEYEQKHQEDKNKILIDLARDPNTDSSYY